MHLKNHGVARGWAGEQGAVGAAASSCAHVPRGEPRAAGAQQGFCHPIWCLWAQVCSGQSCNQPPETHRGISASFQLSYLRHTLWQDILCAAA